MPDEIRELLMIESAVEKLGARGISAAEALQLRDNLNTATRDPSKSRDPSKRGGAQRRLLIGKTDGGRVLTLVIEQTLEPSTWLVITGWTAATHERKMLGG